MAAPTQYGQKVFWGTDSSTKWGLIQSMTIGRGGETKEYKDYNGDIVTIVVSDKHETVSLTVIMAGTTQPTPPEKGEEFTIGTGANAKKYRCTDCSLEWSNEDAAKISISGRTYPSVTAST